MIPSSKSKLYAKAFFNTFYAHDGTLLPHHSYQDFLNYLQTSKKNLFILSMSSLSQEIREGLIDQMLSPFSLSLHEKKLILLLIARKDLDLLPEIILHLSSFWEDAQQAEKWTITSAMELSEKEKDAIIVELRIRMQKEIFPIFIIDTSLYGGFTLKSKEYFLDYSLNAFLNKVNHFIINQG